MSAELRHVSTRRAGIDGIAPDGLYCSACNQLWPCDAEQMRVERDAARAALRRLTEIDQRTPVGDCMALINSALEASE